MRRRPRACEALLAITIGAYVLVMLIGVLDPEAAKRVIDVLTLQRGEVGSAPWTLVTYQFAHDNPFMGDAGGSGIYRLLHLAFNMLGLWVFGRPLEDRIGHIGFIALYLGGGMLAGAGHLLDSPAPVLGASGSVCALVGAFAMLLPRVKIRILVVFILIGIWSVPATWVIAFWMLMDLVGFAGIGSSSTAYGAHLGGYIAGIATGLCLLWFGRTTGDDVDALWMFKQWRRRRAGRAALSRPRPDATTPKSNADHSNASGTTMSMFEKDPAVANAHWLREIESGMRSNRIEGALQRWRRESADAPEACLPAAAQVDLANHLQSAGDWTTAADAYKRLLHHHPDHAEAPMVRLLLGVLLARRLHRPDEAKTLLEQAQQELDNPDHVRLAKTVLLEGPPCAG
jgi:membrane associated rhomboid family serine protease